MTAVSVMEAGKCPGVKSPFGPHVFRKCSQTCQRFEWASEGLKPAMRFDREAQARVCENHLPREAANQP